MQRTNIYLSDDQLDLLRRLAGQRGVPVAALVRQAVDAWLQTQGVRALDEDEWSTRFDALLARRRAIAIRDALDATAEASVERDVAAAVKQVRTAASARRR